MAKNQETKVQNEQIKCPAFERFLQIEHLEKIKRSKFAETLPLLDDINIQTDRDDAFQTLSSQENENLKKFHQMIENQKNLDNGSIQIRVASQKSPPKQQPVVRTEDYFCDSSDDSIDGNDGLSVTSKRKKKYLRRAVQNNLQKIQETLEELRDIKRNINDKDDTLAMTSIKDMLRNMLPERYEKKSQSFISELYFLNSIHEHETRIANDNENMAIFLKFKFSEFVCTFFTVLSIANDIFYYEMKSSYQGNVNQTAEIVMTACLIISGISNVFFSIYNIIIVICTLFRYLLLIALKKATLDYSKIQNLCTTRLWIEMTVEMLMAAVGPNIYFKDYSFQTAPEVYMVQVNYTANDYLTLLALMRCYVIFRFCVTVTRFYDERANRITKMFGWDVSRMFAVKCLFIVHPFLILSLFVLSATFILSYMLKILEGPVYLISLDSQERKNDFRSLSNCLWYTLITMATVGYGDLFPKTNLGRLIGIVASLIGTIFMSLIIISLKQTLETTFMEAKTVELLEIISYKKQISEKAGYYFLSTYRYIESKKKYLKEYHRESKDIQKLRKLKTKLKKSLYEKIRLKKIFRKMIHNFRNVFQLPDDFDSIKRKLYDLLKYSGEMEERGKNIERHLMKIDNGIDTLLRDKQSNL